MINDTAEASKATRKSAAKSRGASPKTARKSDHATRAKGDSTKLTRDKAASAPKVKRTGTKQEKLITMLRRAEGATIDDLAKAFGWQPHTVRGAIAGALKKKLGLAVTSERVEGRGRVYRIAD